MISSPTAVLTSRGIGEINLRLEISTLREMRSFVDQATLDDSLCTKDSERLNIYKLILSSISSFDIDIDDPMSNIGTITFCDLKGTDSVTHPEIDRDPSNSIAHYLKCFPKSTMQSLQLVQENLARMSPNCLVSVCMPMAAHEEENNIYRTLLSLTQQTLPLENFEVVILANHPDRNKSNSQILPDNSISEIERFKKDFPQVNVTYDYVVFEKQFAKIGYVRSFLTDVVLLRHLERNLKEDHIILSADSDSHGYHKEWLADYIKTFQNNPDVEAIGGKLAWSASHCSKSPLLLFNVLAERMIESVFSLRNETVSGPGTNFAFRASSYCHASGYNHESSCGEDVNLRRRIEKFRAGSTKYRGVIAGSPKTTCYTSARRALGAISQNKSLCEQWSLEDIAFGTENAAIRSDRFDTLNFESELISETFFRRAETIFNRSLTCIGRWNDDYLNNRQVERILGFFECDFTFTGMNSVQIIPSENFRNRLRVLKDQYIRSWEKTCGLKAR